MNKEKEIEAMAKAVPANIVAYDRDPKGLHLYGEQREEIAEHLANAGIGNVKQAVKEFAEHLIEYANACKESGYDGIGEQDIKNKFTKLYGSEEHCEIKRCIACNKNCTNKYELNNGVFICEDCVKELAVALFKKTRENR